MVFISHELSNELGVNEEKVFQILFSNFVLILSSKTMLPGGGVARPRGRGDRCRAIGAGLGTLDSRPLLMKQVLE